MSMSNWKQSKTNNVTTYVLDEYKIQETDDAVKVFHGDVEINKYFHDLSTAKYWAEFRLTWDQYNK